MSISNAMESQPSSIMSISLLLWTLFFPLSPTSHIPLPLILNSFVQLYFHNLLLDEIRLEPASLPTPAHQQIGMRKWVNVKSQERTTASAGAGSTEFSLSNENVSVFQEWVLEKASEKLGCKSAKLQGNNGDYWYFIYWVLWCNKIISFFLG